MKQTARAKKKAPAEPANNGLIKAQASEKIDALQQQTGCGVDH